MENPLSIESKQMARLGTASRLRAKLENAFLNLIRLYTYNTPVAKGKYRLQMVAVKMCRFLPTQAPSRTRDGRQFYADLNTGMEMTLFFLGEYEKILTEKFAGLIREGDVCLDVGANFGWYTTLFRKFCGASGEVHAFEPVPATFNQLKRNCSLISEGQNVFINNLALGDRKGEIEVNCFEGLSSGHASISTQGRSDTTAFRCEMVTLDSYLVEKDISRVHIVKVDIEGAELMFLKGAERLFRQAVPPIWLMEMAARQTSNFGYEPNDLIQFMRERANYVFYEVDEERDELIEIEQFDPGSIGANVICIPAALVENRAAAALK
jgi:FkbM family methyltransferase